MMIIQEIGKNPADNLVADWITQFDAEEIINKIWNDLEGEFSRSDIKNVLIEVAPRYNGATILTYIPIFLCRDVRRKLQGSV